MRHPRYNILSFRILAKICFFINHIYLKFRTKVLLISVNMIYTNEVDLSIGY